MNFKSRKIPLLLLTITAFACSRTMLLLFDDPEGPNLLVVVVMAGIIYLLSLGIYSFIFLGKGMFKHFSLSLLTELKRLLIVIAIQIVVATVFYLSLK